MSQIDFRKAIAKRKFWVNAIQNLSQDFLSGTNQLQIKLKSEIVDEGIAALADHLRLCGNIPEIYGHDSSEEKLYSKYTDILLSLSFGTLGLKSLVLTERGDAADVEVFADDFSFVADAKAFRMSRTAKNQKDFKVQAMDTWKRGKPYAMIVCPIHQLPNTSSQIYEQATTRNVCIFTYPHLSVLLRYAEIEGQKQAQKLLKTIFQTVPALNPSKNATDYWLGINKTMLAFSDEIELLWQTEKTIATAAIGIAKTEALDFLAQERERIMRMSHEEAIQELIKINKIENRVKTIESVVDNGLFMIK
jgi:hypothetical protein